MNSQLLKLIELSFTNQTQEAIKTIKITFNDNTSVEIQKLILIWNIPYFDTLLNSNFNETIKNEVILTDFSKETFLNCLIIAVCPEENNILNTLATKLQEDLPEDEFINIMEQLYFYYYKLDYLGINNGCTLIKNLINDIKVTQKLIDLGNRNTFFEVNKDYVNYGTFHQMNKIKKWTKESHINSYIKPMTSDLVKYVDFIERHLKYFAPYELFNLYDILDAKQRESLFPEERMILLNCAKKLIYLMHINKKN